MMEWWRWIAGGRWNWLVSTDHLTASRSESEQWPPAAGRCHAATESRLMSPTGDLNKVTHTQRFLQDSDDSDILTISANINCGDLNDVRVPTTLTHILIPSMTDMT